MGVRQSSLPQIFVGARSRACGCRALEAASAQPITAVKSQVTWCGLSATSDSV